MFINFWYPAARSEDVLHDRPTRVQMLGHRFVLFRNQKGQANCLADTCAHRGGALGYGRIRDDHVECPYHGWRFQGDGRCSLIPSMGHNAKIPARAKVDSYPVDERYGIVFVFLGDVDEESRAPVLPIPEFGDSGWRANLITFQVKCNVERSIENGLDPAHNEFVHPTHGFEGNRRDYRVPRLAIESSEWGAGFTAVFTGREAPEIPTRTAMRTDASGRFSPDVRAGTWYHGPSQMVTRIHMAGENRIHQYLYECPVDELTTNVFLVNLRNCLLDPALDTKMVERCRDVAGQDIAVIEHIAPVCRDDGNAHEILVPADAIVARYREDLRKWTARGWRIDIAELQMQRLRRTAAHVIPSPARRVERNWVLPVVPTVRSSAEPSRCSEGE